MHVKAEKKKSEFEFKPAVIYKEKIVYEGEWEMAEFIRKGYGIEIMPDGSKYIGEFDNFKQGIGRKIWINGDVYEGHWKTDSNVEHELKLLVIW